MSRGGSGPGSRVWEEEGGSGGGVWEGSRWIRSSSSTCVFVFSGVLLRISCGFGRVLFKHASPGRPPEADEILERTPKRRKTKTQSSEAQSGGRSSVGRSSVGRSGWELSMWGPLAPETGQSLPNYAQIGVHLGENWTVPKHNGPKWSGPK